MAWQQKHEQETRRWWSAMVVKIIGPLYIIGIFIFFSFAVIHKIITDEQESLATFFTSIQNLPGPTWVTWLLIGIVILLVFGSVISIVDEYSSEANFTRTDILIPKAILGALLFSCILVFYEYAYSFIILYIVICTIAIAYESFIKAPKRRYSEYVAKGGTLSAELYKSTIQIYYSEFGAITGKDFSDYKGIKLGKQIK